MSGSVGWLVGGVIAPALVLVAALAWLGAGIVRWSTLATEHTARQAVLATLDADSTAALTAARAEKAAVLQEIAALEALAEPAPPTRTFLVIGIQDRSLQLWKAGKVDFKTRVAVGMGEAVLDGEVFRFETPRGRHSVTAKEEAPLWVAPDWHYLERSQKLRVDSVPVTRSRPVTLKDGSEIRIVGDSVAKCVGDACTPYAMGEEVVADNKLIVPPVGTIQRQFPEILGTHRLKMEEGYAIHGTNKPGSIGRAASHGCIRVRNEDIDVLYEKVETGALVIVY